MQRCKIVLERTMKDCVEIPLGEFLKFTFWVDDQESFEDFFIFVLCSVRDGEQFGNISFSFE